MTIEGGWYPVALAADIAPGTATGTRLFGRDLVVWRGGGPAAVWEDRCPHRGMRLSFGFVRDDRLTCLYHGWRFDADGRCRFIPAHPALDVPATITAARFPVAERQGIVWTSADEAPAEAPPPSADGAVLPVRSLAVTAPAADVAAAVTASAAATWEGPLAVFDLGADRVHAALQPLSADASCLHLVVADGGGGAAAQRRVSAWAVALRRLVETAGS